MRLLRALGKGAVSAVVYPIVLGIATAALGLVLALVGGGVVAAILVEVVVSIGLVPAAVIGFLVGTARGFR